MRLRRIATTAALAAAASAAAVAAAAPAYAACPGGSVLGEAEAGVCEELDVTPTANTGATVSGTAYPYCAVSDIHVCRNAITDLELYPVLQPTGADVNGNLPLPAPGPGSGQVSAPAGSYGTVYLNGQEVPLASEGYCVTVDERCP